MSSYYPEETTFEEFLFAKYFDCYSPVTLEPSNHGKLEATSGYENMRSLISKITINMANQNVCTHLNIQSESECMAENEKKVNTNNRIENDVSMQVDNQLDSILLFLEEEDEDDTIELIENAYQSDVKLIINPNDWFNNFKKH